MNKVKIPHIVDGLIYCCGCLTYKPTDSYSRSNNRPIRNFCDSLCKNCKNIQRHERVKNLNKQGLVINILRCRFQSLKARAKKQGYVIDFNLEYLLELWEKQKGFCAISGLPMTTDMLMHHHTEMVFNGINETNVSVDRIDNEKGYLKDNIHLVRTSVNLMKNTFSLEYFISYCKTIADFNK